MCGNMRRLKLLARSLSEELEDSNMGPLQFHMLDHTDKDGSWFSALNFLNASPSEHLNSGIIKYMNMTSVRCDSTLESAVRAMNA